MQHLLDPEIQALYRKDKQRLLETSLPIVTVSSTTREDIKGWYNLPEDETITDIVFSRAHFSMALAIAITRWKDSFEPKKAWLVDPTNYVSQDQWRTIVFTEKVGKLIARNSVLKILKDFIDTFGRKQLPILHSITPPLLYLTASIQRPILSLHIAAGNILVNHGKTIVQVITDPHIRYDYLTQIDNQNLYFCVFDQMTKDDLLEKAALAGKPMSSDRVTVTGPPVDPRILSVRKQKKAWKSGALRLCITTGGLGTNKQEIEMLLRQLLPKIASKEADISLIVYCGTQKDLFTNCLKLGTEFDVDAAPPSSLKARYRLLYHPQIVDANDLLIRYAFPWADGFISKPSGDMAYDAVASGSFLLTLQEWGEWELSIRQRLESLGVARKAVVDAIIPQLEELTRSQHQTKSWIERAMMATKTLPSEFSSGATNIINTYKKVEKATRSQPK